MEFLELGKIEDGLLREAVAAARYKGQWIFSECGLPGGRRLPGNLFRAVIWKGWLNSVDKRFLPIYNVP